MENVFYLKKAKLLEANIKVAFFNKSTLRIVTNDGRSGVYFPHKLVHIEGDQSVIAESTITKSLVHFSFEEIKSVVPILNSVYIPESTKQSLDAFEKKLHAIPDNIVRAILKIKSDTRDYDPKHHVERVYKTLNNDGDIIWAGNMEFSDTAYEWILSMGDNVEILGPSYFIDGYLEFFNKRKIA